MCAFGPALSGGAFLSAPHDALARAVGRLPAQIDLEPVVERPHGADIHREDAPVAVEIPEQELLEVRQLLADGRLVELQRRRVGHLRLERLALGVDAGQPVQLAVDELARDLAQLRHVLGRVEQVVELALDAGLLPAEPPHLALEPRAIGDHPLVGAGQQLAQHVGRQQLRADRLDDAALELGPRDALQRARVGAPPVIEAAVVERRPGLRAAALADQPAIVAVAAPGQAAQPVLAVPVLLHHECLAPGLERGAGGGEQLLVDERRMGLLRDDPGGARVVGPDALALLERPLALVAAALVAAVEDALAEIGPVAQRRSQS